MTTFDRTSLNNCYYSSDYTNLLQIVSELFSNDRLMIESMNAISHSLLNFRLSDHMITISAAYSLKSLTLVGGDKLTIVIIIIWHNMCLWLRFSIHSLWFNYHAWSVWRVSLSIYNMTSYISAILKINFFLIGQKFNQQLP